MPKRLVLTAEMSCICGAFCSTSAHWVELIKSGSALLELVHHRQETITASS